MLAPGLAERRRVGGLAWLVAGGGRRWIIHASAEPKRRQCSGMRHNRSSTRLFCMAGMYPCLFCYGRMHMHIRLCLCLCYVSVSGH